MRCSHRIRMTGTVQLGRLRHRWRRGHLVAQPRSRYVDPFQLYSRRPRSGSPISTDIAGTENGYYIGNVIVDTKAAGTFNANSSGQNDGAAVHIRTARGACIFQHNTIYSVQRGFNIETGQDRLPTHGQHRLHADDRP